MWKFLVELAANAAKNSGRIIIRSGPIIGSTLDVVAPIIRTTLIPAYRYTRALVNPRSHITVINRSQNIVVKDVTPTITAAAQTRKAAAFTASKTVQAVKFAAKIKAASIVRAVKYDVAAPINTTIHAYRFVRYPRIFLGRTSVIERGLDKTVAAYVARTKPVKLNPRLDRTIVSAVRIALYGSSAYAGVKSYEHLAPRITVRNRVNNPDPSSPVHPAPGLDRTQPNLRSASPMPTPTPNLSPQPRSATIAARSAPTWR